MRRIATISAAAAALVLAFSSPAMAAEPGNYAIWNVSGGSGAWSGTGVPAAGFPVATISSNASSVTNPTGASSFLGPATPIGAAFGSSQRQNYLNIGTAPGFGASTTTVDFAKPTPAGKWAFALGDIDADEVTVSALDANGDPVPTAALGFQSTFNYCAVSPRPSGCTGIDFSDVPTWNAATATLSGNTLDTSGAAGWFQPTVPIKSLTLVFARKVGFPVFQLWLATKSVPVETVVEGVTEGCPAKLLLEDANGNPVLDEFGNPVQATTDAGGVATFPAVADGHYDVELAMPGCGTNQGPSHIEINVNTEDGPVVIPPGTFTVFVPSLANTGPRVAPMVALGVALIVVGLGTVRLTRRAT